MPEPAKTDDWRYARDLMHVLDDAVQEGFDVAIMDGRTVVIGNYVVVREVGGWMMFKKGEQT